jgi:hypothetical protein
MSEAVVLYDQLAIESKMKLEAARLGLQKLLDGISAIQWTEENINQDLLAPAREAVDALKKIKEKGKRPHLDANTAYEKAYSELTGIIIPTASAKAEEKKKLAQKMEAERQKIEAENRRVADIQTHISKFITQSTTDVLNAKTANDIAAIERVIGSQMARKAFFAEFIDEFLEKIKPIQALIKGRKDMIREQGKLEEKRESATGDKLAEILDKKEDISIGILQNTVEMYSAVENVQPTETYVGQSTAPYVAPARRQWKFEVTDLGLMHKKHPELITIEANEAAIRQLIADYRKGGQLKDNVDINLPGLRIFQDKIYK